MKMNILLKFCVAALCTIPTISCHKPMVQTLLGLVRGKKQDAVTNDFKFLSFENIPYAAPPVGSKRFKAPEDPVPWKGIRDGIAMGPMCPQYNPFSKINNPGSEDCLTCNVYTRNTEGNSSVLVYIHGFAYSFDGDSADLYGPDFLLKDDVVVVTFNYRLDVLGFLNLGTKDVPGNAGLKDQVALLRWVKSNIASFGGNPNSVTLAGTSSGSASIYHHMMSPMSKGLFHRAIMMSGVPTCDAIYPYKVEEQSYDLGKQLGMETKDGDELLSFLQKVPYTQLINSSYALAMKDPRNVLFKKMAAYVPGLEGNFGQERFITEKSLDGGLENKVDVMTGYCDQEALIVVNEYADYLMELYIDDLKLFVPSKILLNTNKCKALKIARKIKNHYFGKKAISIKNMMEFVQCNSVSSIIYETLRFARKLSQFTDIYLYEFRSVSNRNVYGQEGLKYGITGASHGDTVSYMFNPRPLNLTVDVAVVEPFVSSITNFVKYGNPAPGEDTPCLKFSPHTGDTSYLEITDKVTVKQNPYSEEIRFWDSIYEESSIYEAPSLAGLQKPKQSKVSLAG